MTAPLGFSPALKPAWTPPAMPGLDVAQGAPAGGPSGSSFQGLLQGALSETASLEQNAQSLIGRSLANDESVTQVEVLSAVKKADLSLRMMLQVRNSLLEAYNEIKGMQF